VIYSNKCVLKGRNILKKKTSFILSGLFLVCFLFMIYAVLFIDVGVSKEVPETTIGLSTINNGFHALTGTNILWFDITDYMGISSIVLGLCFALIGLIQLIKGKSFAKVDSSLYFLGGVYVLLGIIYVAFEKIVINYRPIILPDATSPEASFPSSHTLLIFVILATAIIETKLLLKDNKVFTNVFTFLACLGIIVAVFGRLFCGAHWLTDIVSSIFLSLSIIFAFKGFVTIEIHKHDKT